MVVSNNIGSPEKDQRILVPSQDNTESSNILSFEFRTFGQPFNH